MTSDRFRTSMNSRQMYVWAYELHHSTEIFKNLDMTVYIVLNAIRTVLEENLMDLKPRPISAVRLYGVASPSSSPPRICPELDLIMYRLSVTVLCVFVATVFAVDSQLGK